jgi:hypothetical protein
MKRIKQQYSQQYRKPITRKPSILERATFLLPSHRWSNMMIMNTTPTSSSSSPTPIIPSSSTYPLSIHNNSNINNINVNININNTTSRQQQWHLIIGRKVCCVVALLWSLYLISDNNTTNHGEDDEYYSNSSSSSNSINISNSNREIGIGNRRGVLGALARHEPSLRIFRSMFQVNLFFWCTALAIYFWKRHQHKPSGMTEKVIGRLLFAPPMASTISINTTTTTTTTTTTMPPLRRPMRSGGSFYTDHEDDDKMIDDDEYINTPKLETEVDDLSISIKRGSLPLDSTTATSTTIPNAFILSSSSSSDNRGKNNVARSLSMDSETWLPLDPTMSSLREDSDHSARESDDMTNLYIESSSVPSPFSIVNAALDMLLLILLALFGFTLSSNSGTIISIVDDRTIKRHWLSRLWSSPLRVISQIAAPVFPLVLFITMAVQAILPWRHRGPFWVVIAMTLTAPWHEVTFRDAFIGDVLTSSVRPLQDIAFTFSYLLFGLRGWWSSSYHDRSFLDQADANVPTLERSWLVHTIVLPMCMISPLYVTVVLHAWVLYLS